MESNSHKLNFKDLLSNLIQGQNETIQRLEYEIAYQLRKQPAKELSSKPNLDELEELSLLGTYHSDIIQMISNIETNVATSSVKDNEVLTKAKDKHA